MDFTGLRSVADTTILYTALRQEELSDKLDDELGSYTYLSDMDEQTIAFRSDADGSGYVCPSTLLASVAPDVGSLLWGWAHPMGDPEGAAGTLRAFGVHNHVTEMIDPEPALPHHGDRPDAAEVVERLPHLVGAAIAATAQISPYYCIPYGDAGAVAVFGLYFPDLPEPTFTDFAIKVGRILTDLRVPDRRVPVAGIAEMMGWACSWTTDEAAATTTATVSHDGSAVQITFDDDGRRALGFVSSL